MAPLLLDLLIYVLHHSHLRLHRYLPPFLAKPVPHYSLIHQSAKQHT